MLEAIEQNFKFVSNEDFLEKCKDPQQKDGIIKFLHTDDSYYCGLKVDAKSIGQVKDRDIKLQLILMLHIDDFKKEKILAELFNEHVKKLIKEENDKKDDKIEEEDKDDDDKEKINSEASTLTFDYFLSYFLNKDFNEFSSPIEVSRFISKYVFLSNVYHIKLKKHCGKKFEKLFSEENFDLHNCFYTDRKNRVYMRPKQELFDLCAEKNLGAWAGFAFVYLPRSKQTKENFLKIPEEFKVSTFKLLGYYSWKFIDCLSTEQKQELVDKKIITEEDFLNKKRVTIATVAEAICSTVFLAGLIACCILAPFCGSILALVFIALCTLGTILGIGATIYVGHDLYKINKFNEEVGIGQSETAVPSNDTNNPTVTAEVANENTQGNNSPNQTVPQPTMDSQKTCLLI